MQLLAGVLAEMLNLDAGASDSQTVRRQGSLRLALCVVQLEIHVVEDAGG